LHRRWLKNLRFNQAGSSGVGEIKALHRAGIFYKNDERILGDSDFVEAVHFITHHQRRRRNRAADCGGERKTPADAIKNDKIQRTFSSL